MMDIILLTCGFLGCAIILFVIAINIFTCLKDYTASDEHLDNEATLTGIHINPI